MEDFHVELEEIGIPTDLNLITGTNGHSRKLRFLVTGGCGYFAFHLAKSLYALGAHVCILDLHLPSNIDKLLNKQFTFVKGDVRNYSTVYNAVRDVDCVYHAASFGLSGASQLYKIPTEEVNVNGTKNVIKACQELGVERLIYTSSYNVVLGSKPIRKGDESLPYADPNEMVDHYSKTKRKADQLVLEANGLEVEGGGTLKTCCIRPAGIYGPGERRHTERIAGYIENGLTVMMPGNAMVDWVHINNLVQVHLLVIPALSPSTGAVAAGKAYFVSDNQPILMFDFLRPLFHAFNREVPKRTCPYCLMYFIGFLMEILHFLFRPIFYFEPFLTRTEVLKMQLDHYHSMEKAINELGYNPKPYTYEESLQIFLRERSQRTENAITVRNLWLGWSKYFLIGLLLLALLALAI